MKLLLKLLLGLALMLLALLIWATLAHQPQPLAEGSLGARRLAPGPYTVASYTATFVDDSRPTPANGDYPGSPRRELPGEVWYPENPAAGPAPLLLFSHGFTSTYRNGNYLAQHLASHGFVVVAVDFPLTSLGAPGGANVADVASQPGDLSFLIDRLILDSRSSGHALEGHLDGERIGVFGISLGGLTATLVAYHGEWRDPRIDAVISIAGPTAFLKPAFFARRPDLPFLMLAGDRDVLVPAEDHALAVPDKIPGAELVLLQGGSHTGFSGGTRWLRAMSNTDVVGCWSVLRNLDPKMMEGWGQVLGDASLGIDYSVETPLCERDPPPAMNVLRQQMIARLVIRAFFERSLSADPGVRGDAARFLAQGLPAELPEVSYRRSWPAGT